LLAAASTHLHHVNFVINQKSEPNQTAKTQAMQKQNDMPFSSS
jgi:hypothetical protein